MTPKRFRILIFVYIALAIASSLAAFMPGAYSPELAKAMENEPTPWLLDSSWPMLAVMAPLIAIAMLGVYGLYMFKRWGRTLSLLATAIELSLVAFSGPSLYGSLEQSLFDASTMLWGAILALSYFSSLSVQFNGDKAPTAV